MVCWINFAKPTVRELSKKKTRSASKYSHDSGVVDVMVVLVAVVAVALVVVLVALVVVVAVVERQTGFKNNSSHRE